MLHHDVHVTTVVTHDQEEAMEVASRIVVMHHGRIEQVGTPAEFYEHPATEFVMSFVGKVNRIGDGYIRPHEVVICDLGRAGCLPATIERVVTLGFDNRFALALPDGARVWAQVTREEVARVQPTTGQVIGVDLSGRVGNQAATSRVPLSPSPLLLSRCDMTTNGVGGHAAVVADRPSALTHGPRVKKEPAPWTRGRRRGA